MTSKLTRKELLNIIETDHVQCGEASALARMALAAMDSEPVAWDYEWASYITCEGPQDFNRIIEREPPPEWAIEEGQARNIIPLYRHAQPLTDAERAELEQYRKAASIEINDAMALAFCYAISDASVGADDVEDVKIGLRAAFANVATPIMPPVICEIEPDHDNTYDYVDGWNACRAAMLNGGN